MHSAYVNGLGTDAGSKRVEDGMTGSGNQIEDGRDTWWHKRDNGRELPILN